MLVKFPSKGGWSLQRYENPVPPWVLARVTGGTAFVVEETPQEIETAMLCAAERERTGGRAVKPAPRVIEPKNFIRPQGTMFGDALSCAAAIVGKFLPSFSGAR